MNRRDFISTTGLATAGIGLLDASNVLGGDLEAPLKVGLIGSGNRGKLIAEHFLKHGGFKLVALADYFQDRVDAVGDAFKVEADRRFTGLSGYRRLLEQKLDAVIIQSPPYFHPEQAAAAVDAGKHVYMAKPVAVDVPGCLTVEQSGAKASEKKLVFLVDFQTRTHPLLQDFSKRLQTRELGPIISGEASYLDAESRKAADEARRKDPANAELRLRSWLTDRALSGDSITEQAIHSIDMACWFLDAAPVSAYGTGGKLRDYVGDAWDHFSLVYEFPGGISLNFTSKQAGFGYVDILCRLFGMNGALEAHYDGKSFLRMRDDLATGEVKNLYITGIDANIASFHNRIVAGDYANTTVAAGVRSTLATILGRTAAYGGAKVEWKEMLHRKKPLIAQLKGLKS